MAEEKKSHEKTIEMRLAELEDKLSKLSITEEELKAFHKVSALIGGGAPAIGGVSPAEAPMDMTAAAVCSVCTIVPRYINRYININRGITPRRGINECNECGPCAQSGGGFGGGFGGFGM